LCEFDYTYTFAYIGEKLKKGQMSLTDHRTGQVCDLQVAVDDNQLSLLNFKATSSLLADLIDIAAAVHMADRLSKSNGDMPRRILIHLPLRRREVFNTSIQEKLQDVLYWFTEDHWSFEFIPYTKYGRPAQINIPLPLFQNTDQPTRVALWSGGLDSLAGVYQQLLRDDTTHYTLFGTGSNNMISRAQKRTADAIETFFPRRMKLVQLPFRLKDKNSSVKKSSSARSRGFVFMLLGAVCACQEGQNELYIYENGIGAINLPFRKSEVGLDHSRSVHPLSLYYMGELLSSVLEEPFRFKNPFLFWTKAQMCKDLLQKDISEVVFSTISCDSRHRKQPMQCGYCSSCLLRRQAIAVHGVVDKTGYQITERSDRLRRPDDGTHFYAMLEQVNKMRVILSSNDSWQRMSQRYRTLVDIVEKIGEPQAVTQDNLLSLYQNYVHEWDNVKHIIERDFLLG
jgi:7-cyano-7-deazaguanine synthase in queuosine biosynthesis